MGARGKTLMALSLALLALIYLRSKPDASPEAGPVGLRPAPSPLTPPPLAGEGKTSAPRSLSAAARLYPPPQQGGVGLEERGTTNPAAAAPEQTAGSDLPPTGRSRFDQLIGAGPVPFPFQRLLARIDAQLLREPGLPPIKALLIPLGRSLQRAAGAPDYFHYPRAVLTVDGETRPGIPPLKDRLFIGYHEKGALLEVISYNEAAGRFEFQLVRDYRPGGKPEVLYARRALCLACHQNEAPLFARPLWDETPANPAIAARLKAAGRAFYGIPLAGTDVAYFYDNATDRANLLPVWQRLWREGCGDGEAGDACRRELFAAALAQALSGAPAADLTGLARELDRRWPRLWPKGLAIPNPDIPNRDPLAFVPEPASTARRAGLDPELARLAHIPARFEPLQPRPPLEVWTLPDKARLLDGLAGLFAAADLDALDRALAARPVPPRHIDLDCRPRAKGGGRVSFTCEGQGVGLAGALTGAKGGRVEGRLDRLSLAGAPADIRLEGRARGGTYTLEPRRQQRHARLADGRRLVQLVLAEGKGSLVLAEDFAPAVTALANLPALTSSPVFPAWPALADLLTALGARPNRPPAAALPPPRAIATEHADGNATHAAFRRHCGQCHDSPEPFPPNFLAGDAATVARNLAHCAPRIAYRLAMWDQPEATRGKTPMPPPPALAAHGLDGPGWTASRQRADLLAHARRLLPPGLEPDSLTRRPFESLPACLPSARAAAGRSP